MKYTVFAWIMIFVFTVSSVNIFAGDGTDGTGAEETAEQETASAENEDILPYGYIPIKNAALINGAKVEYSDGVVTVNNGGGIYTFKSGSTESSYNGEPAKLQKAPVIIDGTMYADYDDISFLFNNDGMYAETKKKMITSAYYYMYKNKIPSVSMSLADADKNYTWTAALGYKNMEKQSVPTELTTYPMGSLSKIITAMAIFRQIERGKLNLDEKIVTYLPELSFKSHPVYGGNYKDITLRMLLAHVSGLPGDNYSNFLTENVPDENYMNQFLDSIYKEYLDNEPGKQQAYSNAGYTLLGIIAVRADGRDKYYKSFVNYTDELLFDVMELDYTSFEMTSPIYYELAFPYIDSESPVQEYLTVNALPAGGLLSNSKDMARLMHFLLNSGSYEGKRVLSAASISNMIEPADYNESYISDTEWGLGFRHTNVNGLDMTGHSGDIINFHSDMQMSVENKLGFFAAANSGSSRSVISSITQEGLLAAVEEKTGLKYSPSVSAPYYPAELTLDQAKALEGMYTMLGPVEAVSGSQIYLPYADMYMDYYSDGNFYNEDFGKIRFENMSGLDVITDPNDNGRIIAEKINVLPVDLKEFNKYSGNYTPVAEPGEEPLITGLTIGTYPDGYAYLGFDTIDGEHFGAMLSPIEGNMYYLPGTGRNLGKVIIFDYAAGMYYFEIYGVKFVKPAQ